jgi:acetylornithine deacetylase/succinyl-diaminopimelate desuccinylase-like protein
MHRGIAVQGLVVSGSSCKSGPVRLQVYLLHRRECERFIGARWTVFDATYVQRAGHDSVHTSTRVPTAMIFVPCREGLTHNPAEYSSPEDCANGAQVLLGSVLRFDQLRRTS